MKRTCLALSIALVPTVGTAQEFTRYPGLSPQQQHLLEPIRTPPPALPPSAPVQLIQPPAPVQSTTPQVTQYPGSSTGSPFDRSERKVPRGLKPAPQDRSKPPPSELTAPPSELMERSTAPADRTATPQPQAPVATPPFAAPPAAATTPTRAPTALPPATAPPPNGQRVAPPLANQTPTHWQTVTLPPAPDFSRRDEPGGAMPRPEGVRPEGSGMSENAVRTLIEADGYRGVSRLTRGADGVWRGRALRGSTEIGVGVDANGRVSAE